MEDALVIGVVDQRLLARDGEDVDRGIVVLVEPLYGCVAVAAALDAGWNEVELAPLDPDAEPIPLVSFEQRPTGSACRIRCDDLLDAQDGWLLGCPANARPLASLLARTAGARVTFVPALAAGDVAADSWWAAGMLARVLLDELDGRPSQLTDAAGIAVTLAQGAEPPEQQLVVGARWRAHLERGGHADDLRVAAAIDSIGAVPVVARGRDGDVLVARAALV